MPKDDPFNRLARFLGDRISLFFLVAVAFTFYEVVMRYVFNAPTVWVHDMTIGLSAVAFVVGGAYAMQRRDHIRITLVYEMFPPLGRRVLDVINLLITLGFLAALGHGAWKQAGRALAVMERTGTASNLPVPVIVKTVLLCGVALMFLQSLAHLWGHLRGKG
jgi:TRAP-type C4-dicarboxylate transport system permease small subunit